MNYQQLFIDIEEYVVNIYETHGREALTYHNLEHTQYVVKKATQITAHYDLLEEDVLVILLAAWFHDVGYLFGEPLGHEERSVDMMREFANKNNFPEDVVNKAADCILATKLNSKPENLLEQIVSDADCYNLGTKRFKKSNQFVYTEMQALGSQMSELDYHRKAAAMLEQQTYHTKYVQEKLKDSKLENMKKLKKKITDLEADKQNKDLIINEKQGTTKGMQTMLRLTSANHVQLSEMADAKANILISVNAIIISVILSVLLRKLGEDPYLTIPTLIFLTSAVATIVLAIMATRPKVNEGTFSQEDIDSKRTNLLFFGNFHKMDFISYDKAMKTMMTDADYLYGSMIQDIFVLGTVLGKKYKLLRVAYTLFMIGIIVSVLAFAIASIISGSAPIEMRGPASNTTGSPF